MDERSAYELLDAGDGRRLERFGPRVVDRPAPAAGEPRRRPAAWAQSDLRFERGAGWEARGGSVDAWTIGLDRLTLELRPTEAGQVGWFPEHAALWPSLRNVVAARPAAEVLHLFGYTGATTLALAREGARVTHVDASRTAIAWARRNAELSELADAPIRWIVDDAEAYLTREIRRGRRYDAIVLDPPSYGRGTGARRWEFETGLPALLDATVAVARPGASVLLTTHTTGWDGDRLVDAVSALAGGRTGDRRSGDLTLTATSGALLSLGAFVRCQVGR